MSKILAIGDLHTKTFLLPFLDTVIAENNPDKIILMGDYFDDWYVDAVTALRATEDIINWARGLGATVLFGNHDVAYFSKSGRCPGNKSAIIDKAHTLLNNNLDILCVAAAHDNWLFTHAGLCQAWAELTIGFPSNAQGASDSINMLLDKNELLADLETIGQGRGGHQSPSPLWADWSELLADYMPNMNQIVGHSPSILCESHITKTSEVLWRCDTFSASSTGWPYGAGSMLLLDSKINKVSTIYQPDKCSYNKEYGKHYKLDRIWS